jgi:hypothetical protein
VNPRLKSAFGEEVPRRGSHRRPEPFGVKFRSRLVRGQQSAPLALLVPGDVAALLVGELDAGPGGEVLHGLGEREVVDLLHEPDDVTAVRAGEAVPKATGRGHIERRGFLVMERAQTLERPATGVAELEVLADDLGDG